MIALVGLLWVPGSTARLRAIDPPAEPELTLAWNAATRVADVSFPTERGVLYTLERSTDIAGWNALGAFPGHGGVLTLRIDEAEPGGQEGGNPEPAAPAAAFAWSAFAAPAPTDRILLGLPTGRQVLLASGLVDPAATPAVLATSVGDPPQGVTALRADQPWSETYLGAAFSPLPEDVVVISLFLDAVQAVLNDPGHNGTIGAAPPAPAALGAPVAYRIAWLEFDTDGDGIPDREELALFLNPFNPDTDGDGVHDGDERAFGSDPNDPQDLPEEGDTDPQGIAFEDLYQRARIKLQGGTSILSGSMTPPKGNWFSPIPMARNLPPLSGPTAPNHPVQSFRRGARYVYTLTCTDEENASTVTFEPLNAQNQTATWNGWVQVGPEGAAPPGLASYGTGIPVSILPVELDVDNDASVLGEVDGLLSYLPGYTGDAPMLHEGEDFESAGYREAQAMQLIIGGLDPAKVDGADFEIVNVTNREGYCGNGLDPDALGAGNSEDFSFLEGADLRTRTEELEGGRVRVPVFCKDYGGAATIQITLKKNGSPVGTTAIVTVPHDGNGDFLADRWQNLEITAWNTQFGTDRPTTEAERDAMGPDQDGAYPDNEEADPDGATNGDGGRDLPEMAAAGDGLTTLEEYRGYLFDGGPGIEAFTHRRLGTARKELLVEARVETDLAAPANNGTETTETIIATNQPVLATFDEAATLEAVRDMYRHPTRGAAIDLYWAFVALNSDGPVITYDPDTFPDRPAFRWNGEVRYIQGVSVIGGGLVYFDAVLRAQNSLLHDSVYGVGNIPHSGLIHAINRHDSLRSFAKHLFVSRSGPLWITNGTQWLRANYEPHSVLSNEEDVARQGTRIDVGSLADEGFGLYSIERHFSANEFEVLGNVATGHEIGHLLVGSWHEVPGAGTLMGNQQFPVVENGALVRIDGLDDVEWSDEAIGRINFPERLSVE